MKTQNSSLLNSVITFFISFIHVLLTVFHFASLASEITILLHHHLTHDCSSGTVHEAKWKASAKWHTTTFTLFVFWRLHKLFVVWLQWLSFRPLAEKTKPTDAFAKISERQTNLGITFRWQTDQSLWPHVKGPPSVLSTYSTCLSYQGFSKFHSKHLTTWVCKIFVTENQWQIID